MDKIGKYIYGIINSNTSFCLFAPECSEAGNRTNGVYTVPYQEFGAVICDSVVVESSQMEKETLAKQLLTHQKVIEKIMACGVTIIPMKLGTYAFDEDEVKLILEKGCNLIREIADKIDKKIEIDVVASWADFGLILKEAGEDREIKEFKEKLFSSGRKITTEDQMKAGCMLKNALEKKSAEYTEKIQKQLAAVSANAKRHEVMDDTMIMNCAFLINKAEKDEFYKRIEDLNDEFGEKVNFKCVGPLPAYSFYTLEVKKIHFSEVDSARQKLGILNDWASEDDIKKAYHLQAVASHPDKHQGREEANIEFDGIKKSYNILLEYAAAYRQRGESLLAFSESEFKKNEILVKVKE